MFQLQARERDAVKVSIYTPLFRSETDCRIDREESLESFNGSESDSLEDVPSVSTPLTTTSESKKWRPNIYKCTYPDCERTFNRPCRLAEHQRSHTNERPYVCTHPGCDKSFIRDQHLSRHVKSAHTSERDFACSWPGCDKRFVNGTRLRRHEAAHQQKERFRCTDYPPCNEIFRKHSTLQSHIASVHLEVKPWQCEHIDEATGEQCSAAYMQEGKLRFHTEKVHSGLKRFSCMICSADTHEGEEQTAEVKFTTHAALQEHIREAHPPMCEVCDRMFLSQAQLTAHIEVIHSTTNSERATFACEEPGCNKAFTKRGNLVQHVRSVHRGEKPFVCGETDVHDSNKFFDDEGQRVPWDGDGCGRGFGTKASLEDHVRTQHLGLHHIRKAKKARNAMSAGGARQRRDKGTWRAGEFTLENLTGAKPSIPYADEDKFWLGGFDEAQAELAAYEFERDDMQWSAEDAEANMFLDRQAGIDRHDSGQEQVPIDPSLDAVRDFLLDG